MLVTKSQFEAAISKANTELTAEKTAHTATATQLAQANARIAELEADIEAGVATAKESTDAVGKVPELEAKLKEANASLVKKDEEIAEAKKATAAAEASAGKKASQILASAAHPAVEVTESKDGGEKTMTRAAWRELGARARATFFSEGGKLTDQ